MYNAITSPAYLTVNGGTPKVSFGDDDSRTGVYRFSFEVNNLSDQAQTYVLDGCALTDQVDLTYAAYGYTFMGETSRNLDASVAFSLKNGELPLQYDYNGDGETGLADVQALLDAVNGLAEVQSGYDLTADGVTDTADAQALYELISSGFTALNVVEVPANGSVRVHVTVTLSEADKAYMDTYYENGIYVDGFIRLYAQSGDAVDLSLPFLGFYGDWSAARIFDSGWYYDGNPEYNRYINVFFTDYGSSSYVLGQNPYAQEDYDPSHNVLSPNGDGYLDQINEIYLSLMRSVRSMNFTVRNTLTGNTLYQATAEGIRKSYYYSAYGLCLPMIVSQYCYLYDFRNLDNGARLELTVDACLDDGDNAVDESLSVPIVIDTEAPVIYTGEIAYLYNPYTDTRRLEFYVSDNYAVAAVIPLTDAGDAFDRITVEDAPGEKILVSLDVTDYDSSFVLAVCDYGCNESYYKVTFQGRDNVDFDAFYAFRSYSAIPNSGYLYPTDALNGWYSFETADAMLQHTSQPASNEAYVAAAEYLDGYIVGVDMGGNLFAMRSGDWSRTLFGKLELDGVAYPALDMAFDYTTGTLYVLTDELEIGAGGHLAKVNYLTGEVTDVGVVTGIDSETAQGITLACDNQGVLYTIDYSTGALYTIDKKTAKASYVGETGYVPQYQQSMTLDHGTDTLYWAAYQGYAGDAAFFEVNKATGELTRLAATQYTGEMTGLMKPFRSEKALYPEDTALTGLVLSKEELMLSEGKTGALSCKPWPYYAQLGEVTWTSADESVATVEDGVVTAIGAGETVITASVGDITATCSVTVGAFSADLRLYNTIGKAWLSLDAAAPQNARTVENAIRYATGFAAATYYNGRIYVADKNTGLYRLNPETLQGEKICNTKSKVSALCFNYDDAYLYGITSGGNWMNPVYNLVRVNTADGDVQTVQQLDTKVVGNLSAIGGFTVDYDGNFYLISKSTVTFKAMLVKFRVENDQITGIETADLTEYTVGPYASSMVYSGANEGLFWANGKGQLVWLDGSDMENVRWLTLGDIPNSTNSAGSQNVCLLEIPEWEPEIQYAEPTGVTLSSSYTILEGGTVNVGLVVEPWNAKADAAYSVKDPSIAAVDQEGKLTGIRVGETSLGVYVEALDTTLEAKVQVVKSTGNLYGFMQYDFYSTRNKWIQIPDTNLGAATALASSTITVNAGAYYGGYVYAYCNFGSAYSYARGIMKVNLEDYSMEPLSTFEYRLRDMDFDYTTGVMYAIAEGATVDGALVQVDLETGEMILMGDSGLKLSAMTVDGQGRVFAIGQDGYLYRLDKATGEATQIGHTGAVVSITYQSMHYDPDTGNTYWNQVGNDQSSSMRLVNLETGATSSLGLVGTLGAVVTAMYTVPDVAPAIPETVEPTGVLMNAANTVAVGETVELNARVLPASVAQVDGTLTWTSDNESVATVKDGTVTGVSAGIATITATAVNGKSATCTVYVTENQRRFYAYDENNSQWISFAGENTAEVTVERVDAEGESPIAAAYYTGETIYAFDSEGRFCTVDPETFERTSVGEGISGMNVTLQVTETMSIDCSVVATDLSYDNGKLYALLTAEYNGSGAGAVIGEVDVTTGQVEVLFTDVSRLGGNLLVENGRALYVDVFTSGVLCKVDLYSDAPASEEVGQIVEYWGRYFTGRSLFRDAYTGTVYSIWDKTKGANTGGQSTLVTMNPEDPSIEKLGLIGEGVIVNSLFIR